MCTEINVQSINTGVDLRCKNVHSRPLWLISPGIHNITRATHDHHPPSPTPPRLNFENNIELTTVRQEIQDSYCRIQHLI